ncbi:MAG: phosphoribosylanthranilate isomerase [Aestuariibaculum sp.]
MTIDKKLKFKICGMKYPENIQAVTNLLPDYIGFIFYKRSARYFDGIIPELPKNIKKTGVFVDENIETVSKKIEQYGLQAVQLHGNESVKYCKDLQKQNIEIIKAFSVNNDFDFSILSNYETVCNYFLFDTKGKLPGGNGYTFNWSILNKYPSTKPYFLSGGIGIDEIKLIKKFTQSKAVKYCYALDVNSKFETKPGWKDTVLLKDFKNTIFN